MKSEEREAGAGNFFGRNNFMQGRAGFQYNPLILLYPAITVIYSLFFAEAIQLLYQLLPVHLLSSTSLYLIYLLAFHE